MAQEKRTSNTKAHRQGSPAATLPQILTGALRGAGMALLLGLCPILPLAGICLQADDPTAPLATLGVILCYAVFFLGGILTVRRNRGAVLLSGLLSGGILSLILMLARLVMQGPSAFSPVGGVLLRVLALAFSLFGAYLGRIRIASSKRGHGHKHQGRH